LDLNYTFGYMKKIDLKKDFAGLYTVPKGKIVMVDVPELSYLMIDGKGDPNHSTEFQEAIEALYSLSYTLKFNIKKGPLAIDYGVMPLEGLWWSDQMESFTTNDRSKWLWTLMIMQPDFINTKMVKEAMSALTLKKTLKALPKLRFEKMKEGKVAQILHIGPYDQETENILKLHAFIKDNGFQLYGKHREIYLSDMRRTAPEKLKTIIRQPMRK